MKKDKKFLEELASFLEESKHKDEIVSKYESFIKSEKESGKKIKDIIKSLGDPKELAEKELLVFKDEKKNIFDSIKNIFKSKKKEEKKKEENKPNLITRLKSRLNKSKDNKNTKVKKEKKDKKDKTSFKEKLNKFKTFITKDLTAKKERKITDSPKEIVEEVKEEVNDKISDVAEIVSEKHIFESKAQRTKRIVLRTLGIILTCLLVFMWLWVTVIFFASLFAYLDGIKFKGIILGLFGLDALVLWIVVMINRAIFRKKMSLRLNLIIVFVSVALIALGSVMAFREIKEIDYVQDVSEKYAMTRKLETFDLPKEANEKFIITFNSNYNTQYVIKHDKNIKGKVKIETRYYEVYYDYYTKASMNGVYVSLKLDDRDRFSVYLDDIKEGKIYDNDELSRYTVKITVNPNEADKIAIQ